VASVAIGKTEAVGHSLKTTRNSQET